MDGQPTVSRRPSSPPPGSLPAPERGGEAYQRDRAAAEGAAPADTADRPFPLVPVGLDETPGQGLIGSGVGLGVLQRKIEAARQIGAGGDGLRALLQSAQLRDAVLREEAVKEGIPEADFDAIVRPENMIKPG